jgi:A/G-specific adenine glycosylase
VTRSDGALRAAILRWYLEHRRDLPWRRTRDPYAIWVSEIMLQQTRVGTVIPYYERFLERFPTVAALAAAAETDVLAAWSGLGYYGRARSLRHAAFAVVREHAGRIPGDPGSLRALPGIGDYTAAAIASVAFDRPAAAVDGNVIRVIARLEGWRGRRDAPGLRRAVLRRAEALADGPRPGDWTQALMELGATICLPREPLCARCPVARRCAARASGAPGLYPAASAAGPAKAERRLLLVARRAGSVLLVPDASAEGATWTLPTATLRGNTGSGARAARALAGRLGQPREVRGPLARFKHRTFSHDLALELWEVASPTASPTRAGRWVTTRELDRLPVRAPTLKALSKLRRSLGATSAPEP